MGDHLDARVVLLEQMQGIDVEGLPAVEGAGGVILTVFRQASALGPARFPVEAGNGLGPVEGGLSSRQLIPLQHVLDDDETVAFIGLYLALYEGLRCWRCRWC